MENRVLYVDYVRGLAIILMAFWQVFDFFSKYNIYADKPFFLTAINAPIHFPVLVMFSGMAGAGIYLYVSKIKKKSSFKQTLPRMLKKYLWLVVISLFFTTFVWNFCTFYTWSEAIQGIGVVGIFAFLIIWTDMSASLMSFLAIILGIFQEAIKPFLNSLVSAYPFCVSTISTQFFISLPANFLFRGFFSVLNLLPMMLWGAAMTKLVSSRTYRRAIILGIALIFFGIVLDPVVPINFYARSPTSFMIEIGILTFVMGVMFFISKTRFKNKASLILLPFGRDALIVYLAHFLLVYKVLTILGLDSTFNLPVSFAGAAIFLIASNIALNKWRKQYSQQQ